MKAQRLSTWILIGTSLFTSAAAAWADPGRRPFPGPGFPGSPPAPITPISQDEFTQTLRQRFTGRTVIPLREMLGISAQFNGRNVESVTVSASTQRGFGDLRLLVNHMQIDTARNLGTWTQEFALFTDPRASVLGRDIQTLELELNGEVNIDRITVRLAPDRGGGGRRNVVEVAVNQSFQGGARLPLRRLLNLGQEFSGQRIESVILTARSDSGWSKGTLILDGYAAGSPVGISNMMQEVQFALDPRRNVLDQDFRMMEMELRGFVTVSRVAVRFAHDGRDDHRPPPYERPATVSNRVDREFRGDSFLDLRQLIGIGPQFEGRRIESVTLVASTRAGRGQAQLSLNGVVAGTPQTVGTLSESHLFVVPGNSVLGRNVSQLGIALRGNFFIESVAVTFAQF